MDKLSLILKDIGHLSGKVDSLKEENGKDHEEIKKHLKEINGSVATHSEYISNFKAVREHDNRLIYLAILSIGVLAALFGLIV